MDMDTDARDDDRWMYLAGPLFTLLVVLLVLVQGSPPGEKDSVKEVVAHFTDKEARTFVSVFLSGPAVAALLVFVSRLRAGIDDRARAARSLAVAGGGVYGTAILVSTSVLLATNVSANNDMGDVARTLNVLSASLWIPGVIGIGVMLLGAGLAVLRTGILPRWLGWVATVVGVVSFLGPGGFAGFLVGPLWIGVAGVMLYLRKPVAATV